MKNNSINRYGNPNATQGFILKRMAARTSREKNNYKVVPFPTLLLICTLKWVTEKELERVIANKGDEFHCKKNMKMP